MKFLSKIATFFAIVYLALMLHSLMHETKEKSEAIALFSSHEKSVGLSLAYRSPEYKRFVYAK